MHASAVPANVRSVPALSHLRQRSNAAVVCRNDSRDYEGLRNQLGDLEASWSSNTSPPAMRGAARQRLGVSEVTAPATAPEVAP